MCLLLGCGVVSDIIVDNRYLQRTCVLQQDPAKVEYRPSLPRAYFTTKEEYYKDVTDEEMSIIAMFIDSLGHSMFGFKTKMTGLLGVPGTNKSTFSDMMLRLNGGRRHVLMLDSKVWYCVWSFLF